MANKQVVSTLFKAKDAISSVFTRMGKNSRKFGDTAEDSFKKASRGANKFQNVTKSILKASAIQKSFSLLTEGVTQAATSFVGFDDALFSAAAKFEDIDLKTKKGKETFKQLGLAARKTGAMTQFTGEQAAQGLNFLALAGVNAKNAMEALPSLADLATAAEMESLGQAVDIATDSLGAFGLATKDSAQLIKNLNRVSDVFAKTQGSSNTTIEALFEAVGKGGPALALAGQSVETFSSLIGILANSTLKGGEAGTQLRNIMLRLSNPTAKATKELKKMRVRVRDNNQDFRDMIDILADVEKGTKNMGTAQKAQSLAIIFGSRAITGVGLLLDKGAKGLSKYRTKLVESTGATKEMAEIMRRSLGNKLKSLMSAATEVAFKFFDAFKDDGVKSIDSFTKSVRKMDVTGMIDAMKTLASVTSDVHIAFKSILTIMSPLIAAMIAYKLTVIATTAAQALMSAGVFVYQLLTNSLKATMVAQWALNAAMNANPIGLAVAGVVLLIGAFVLLVKNWDTVKKSFVDGGNAILRIFRKIGNIVGGLLGGGFSIFGSDDVTKKASKARGPQIFRPPNKSEAEAQAQRFEGVLSFENKPDNVSFRSKSTGAPLIDLQGLGAN